jgi:hypothetical protein
MFGDTSSGGCGSFGLGDFAVGVDHPTFNCSRANLAENNAALPVDRVFLNYQHFHNISSTDFATPLSPDATASIDIDRVTFGWERTFCDGLFSLDVRVPVTRQLSSDLLILSPPDMPTPAVDERNTELGNLTGIFKLLLVEGRQLSLSTGLGLNVPTARDVQVRFVGGSNALVLPQPPLPPVLMPDFFGVSEVTVRNETFNLSPFLAALWTPSDRVFLHGFAQWDLPLNPFSVETNEHVFITGPEFETDPIEIRQTSAGELSQQELLRLNLGVGYWLWRNPASRGLTALVPTIEMHYTTTLEDAEIFETFLPVPVPGSPEPLLLPRTLGNLANRVDLLNLAAGSTAFIGQRTTIAAAGILPLRNDSDKPFDFEANVQLNYFW